MKVYPLADEIEGSMHVGGRPGNVERNIGKSGHAILQRDMPSQIGNDRRRIIVVSRSRVSLAFFLVVDLLALSALAQIIHFFLGLRFRETAVIDPEIAN